MQRPGAEGVEVVGPAGGDTDQQDQARVGLAFALGGQCPFGDVSPQADGVGAQRAPAGGDQQLSAVPAERAHGLGGLAQVQHRAVWFSRLCLPSHSSVSPSSAAAASTCAGGR